MQKPSSLNIEFTIWPRDSYGLFDYESSKVLRSSSSLSLSSSIMRKENEVFLTKADSPLVSLDMRHLFQIRRLENGHFVALPEGNSSNSEKLWLAVRGLNECKGYQLCKGDVLRLGRLKFRVLDLKGSINSEPLPGFKLSDILNGKNEEDIEENGTVYKLPCRICLSEVFAPDNPLISPCKCTGTMKYIHIKCLQLCLKSKISTKSNDSVLSFNWKTIHCDLCKKSYPSHLKVSGKVVQLIEFPTPPEKFLVLETLCKEKGSNKGIYVVSFYEKSIIRIGRGHDNELRVSDISVSRLHSHIFMHNDKFFIQDNQSKFGTLVQVKRPIVLSQYGSYWFQSGSSLSKIYLERPWSFFCSCFSYEVSPFESTCDNFALYPINSGICLSKYCDSLKDYKKELDLPVNYNKIGFNSSYEEDTFYECEIEQVEIAENSSDNADISAERSTSYNYLM